MTPPLSGGSAKAGPLPRAAYEGAGGWKDGRLGQAYDLLWAVLEQRGETTLRHPLLTQIETMDWEIGG